MGHSDHDMSGTSDKIIFAYQFPDGDVRSNHTAEQFIILHVPIDAFKSESESSYVMQDTTYR
jgi:hypothetical protein